MTIPGPRVLNLAGFLCCVGMMGFALYAQHGLLLDPCPLCVLQRVAVIGLGVALLLAAIHGPAAWGRWVYALLVLLSGGFGIGVAGWHWRLQNLPQSEVPSCGPGLDYMLENFPLGEAMRLVFQGSGECAEVVWRFLGLSMPAWVFVCLLGMTTAGIWNNLRKQ